MLAKPCLDCGAPTRNGSRCLTCQAQRDAASDAKRGSSRSRGYDGEYQRNRPAVIAQGTNGRPCVICGQEFTEGQKITVEHITPLRNGGNNSMSNLGPAHSACNTAWNRKRLDATVRYAGGLYAAHPAW